MEVKADACGDDVDPNIQHSTEQPGPAKEYAMALESRPTEEGTHATNYPQDQNLLSGSDKEGPWLLTSDSSARELARLSLGDDISDASDTTQKEPPLELLEVESSSDAGSGGPYPSRHSDQILKGSTAVLAGGNNPSARQIARRASTADAPQPLPLKVCDLILDMDAAAAAVSAALTGIPGGPPAPARKNGLGDAAASLGARHSGPVPPPPPPPRRSPSLQGTPTAAFAAGGLFGLDPKAGLYQLSMLHSHGPCLQPPPPPPPRQYMRPVSLSPIIHHMPPPALTNTTTSTTGRITTRVANVVGAGAAAGGPLCIPTPSTTQCPLTIGCSAVSGVPAGPSEPSDPYSAFSRELQPRWRVSISGPTVDLGKEFAAPQRPTVRWHASSSGVAPDLPPCTYTSATFGCQGAVSSSSYLPAPSLPPQLQHPFQGTPHPLLTLASPQFQSQHLQPQPQRQARSGPVNQQQQHSRPVANRLLAMCHQPQLILDAGSSRLPGITSCGAQNPPQSLHSQAQSVTGPAATAGAAASAVGSSIQSLQPCMLTHPHGAVLQTQPQAQPQLQPRPQQHRQPLVPVLGLKEMGFGLGAGDGDTSGVGAGVGVRTSVGVGAERVVAAAAAAASGSVMAPQTSPRLGPLHLQQQMGTPDGEQGHAQAQLLALAPSSDNSRPPPYLQQQLGDLVNAAIAASQQQQHQQHQQQLLTAMAAAAAWQRLQKMPEGPPRSQPSPSAAHQQQQHRSLAPCRPPSPLTAEGGAPSGSQGSGSRHQANGGRLHAVLQDDPNALVRLYEKSLAAAVAEAQRGRGPASIQQLHHERELLHKIADVLAVAASNAAGGTPAVHGGAEADGLDMDLDLELRLLLVSSRCHAAEWSSLSEPLKYGILAAARALSLGLFDTAGTGQALCERWYGTVHQVLCTVAAVDEPFLATLRAAMSPLSQPIEGAATSGSGRAPLPPPPAGDAASAEPNTSAAPGTSPKLARCLVEALRAAAETATSAGAADTDTTAATAATATNSREWSWRRQALAGVAGDSDCDTGLGTSSEGATAPTGPSSTLDGGEPGEEDAGSAGLGGGGGAAAAARCGPPLPEARGVNTAAAGAQGIGGDVNTDQVRQLGRSSSAPARREAPEGRLLSNLFSSFNNTDISTTGGGGTGGGGGGGSSFGPHVVALDAGALSQLLDDGSEVFGAAAAAAALGGWRADGGGGNGAALDSGGSAASSSVLASFLESYSAARRSSMVFSPLLDRCSSGSLDLTGLSLSIQPSPRTSPANPLTMRRELAASGPAPGPGAEVSPTACGTAAAGAAALGPQTQLPAVPPPGGPGRSVTCGIAQLHLPPPELGPPQAAAVAATAGSAVSGLAGPYTGFPLDVGGMARQLQSMDMRHFNQQPLSSTYLHCSQHQQHQQHQQQYQQPLSLDPALAGGMSDTTAEALLGALDSGEFDSLSWDAEALHAALRILQTTAQLDG